MNILKKSQRFWIQGKNICHWTSRSQTRWCLGNQDYFHGYSGATKFTSCEVCQGSSLKLHTSKTCGLPVDSLPALLSCRVKSLCKNFGTKHFQPFKFFPLILSQITLNYKVTKKNHYWISVVKYSHINPFTSSYSLNLHFLILWHISLNTVNDRVSDITFIFSFSTLPPLVCPLPSISYWQSSPSSFL